MTRRFFRALSAQAKIRSGTDSRYDSYLRINLVVVYSSSLAKSAKVLLLSRANCASVLCHPDGGGRYPGVDGFSRAWRIVCTETPAASAISAWLMQPATRSVAVLKSMALVHVGIDFYLLVYYLIYQQGEKQGCRIILRRC
jgi:hypothetical protein